MTARGAARAADGVVVLLALALSFTLKLFYSGAGFDQLTWILGPTTRVVDWLSGGGFELEPHHGYLSRKLLYQIVPSCSGVNFMIATFCTLVCGLVHTRLTLVSRLVFVAVCGPVAYVATVMANAVRISIAIHLPRIALARGLLTPERLHRIEGVVVYFVFLCVTFWIAARWTGARLEPARS